VYWVFRAIGRLAFPLYAFLLAEGARRTKHPARYSLRLGIFAVLADPCFGLAFGDGYRFGQNVLWTLLLALAACLGFRRLTKPALQIAVCIGSAVCAELLGTDYGAVGVLVVLFFYWAGGCEGMRRYIISVLPYVALFCQNVFAIWALPAFCLTALYNGTRGKGGRFSQFFFYAYYPLHLLVLFLVKRFWCA